MNTNVKLYNTMNLATPEMVKKMEKLFPTKIKKFLALKKEAFNTRLHTFPSFAHPLGESVYRNFIKKIF